MAHPSPSHARSLARRVAGEGALLFSGFAVAQGLSFARNALIGHWLSKGDFGIAATITMMLQLVDTLTDLGADRLIVQAEDGDSPQLVATSHATLIARGTLTALVLFLAAGPVAHFFAIEEARWAFEAVAIVPFLKGFVHLDCRRAQRRLDNAPQVAADIVPQGVALTLAPLALTLLDGTSAIVCLAVLQAAIAVLVTQGLAERRYAVALDRGVLTRLITFGWPIWASAFPLVAVYYGDRILIGRLYGMEALAGYTAAFMIAMVPGLIGGKVGHALILPLLAEARVRGHGLAERFAAMSEAIVAAAALYLALFVIAGGDVLPLAFGAHYAGLGTVVGWLALMWALRMLQAVPGMALMAAGETRPLLVAGLIRAAALVPAAAAAFAGWGIAGVAAAGVAGELASLVYVAVRCGREDVELTRIFLTRSLFIVPAGIGSLVIAGTLPENAGLLASTAASAIAAAGIVAVAVSTLPEVRKVLLVLQSEYRSTASQAN